jgi:hypothetical protein
MTRLAEKNSEKKDKTERNSDPNCPVVIVSGILRENRRGGRPGATVSPIVNRLQHVFTAKPLLVTFSAEHTLGKTIVQLAPLRAVE